MRSEHIPEICFYDVGGEEAYEPRVTRFFQCASEQIKCDVLFEITLAQVPPLASIQRRILSTLTEGPKSPVTAIVQPLRGCFMSLTAHGPNRSRMTSLRTTSKRNTGCVSCP